MQGGGIGMEQIFFLVVGLVMFAFAAKRLIGRQKSWEKPDPVDPELEEIKKEREAAKLAAEMEAKAASDAAASGHQNSTDTMGGNGYN